MFAIGLILAAACLFVILWWWSEGAVEASEAVLLAVVYCGLIFGLFAARELWQFLLAFIPLTAAGGYAVYSWRSGSVRAYYKKRCGEYMLAIQADPRNVGARQYLAETFYNLGDLDRAIAEMEAAVDMGAGIESQYRLGKWTKERYVRDCPNPICRFCETENPQDVRACMKCGADLPYQNAFTRWLTGGASASARYYLLVIIGISVVAMSLCLLPLKFAFIPLGMLIVALAGWSLISSSRN